MSADSAAAPAAAGKASKKQQKKDEKKTKKNESADFDYTTLPASTVKLFLADDSVANLKVALIAALCSTEFMPINAKNPYFPVRPSLMHNSTQLFGANAVVRYLLAQNSSFSGSFSDASVDDLLNYEQHTVAPALASGDASALQAALSTLESHPALPSSTLLHHFFYSTLQHISTHDAYKTWFTSAAYPQLHQTLQTVSSVVVAKAQDSLLQVPAASASANTSVKADAGVSPLPEVTPSELDSSIDWAAAGLMSSLKLLFTAAITAAFPESVSLSLQQANIARCANIKHGDFQCNNALTLAKALKPLAQYAALSQPRLVAERIVAALPRHNPVVLSAVAAPNGFINVTLQPSLFTQSIADKVQSGRVAPPQMPSKKVLVDFSSPNIAKEMHVGHLRSTIIGDALCRILEYTRHDVLRVNHVGDWGTQFGMLITYLQKERPDFLNEDATDASDISYLTKIYKESKKRFDEDVSFKETARLNVVKLQAGDEACRAIWLKLCEISRREFQKVYDMLGVHLTETGESFYNPLIPSVIEELKTLNLVTQDQGMEIILLPHFTIPLIVRKSDGGFGYDSTDMAALKHRLTTLQRDWIIIITDAGQATHFQMCFDAARAANWITHQRLDHIGFGVVCGDDGKRFKTRSSETVKLIDLLNAAKLRMHESLTQRSQQQLDLSAQAASAVENNDEGALLAQKKVKNILPAHEIDTAAARLGYGAVKYFDLKQHPQTNYVFNYDHMLNTKGDTAVYLLFAYARLASILRKAEEEKGISLSAFKHDAMSLLSLDAPEERALAFELLNFGDVIQYVLQELLPNRLCDYLKEVCVKFTDFVTHCQVLPSAANTTFTDAALRTTQSRLLLCEATRLVLQQCFDLLGIEPCDRI